MLYDWRLPPEGALSFHASIAEAVAGADWVQESVPERLDLKHGSSTTSSAACRGGDRLLNLRVQTLGAAPDGRADRDRRAPVQPGLPAAAGRTGALGTCGPAARGGEVLRSVGMFPLTVRKEIDAHIADRFLEAVWREALWLVKDGIATTEEIDEAIRMGFGLRWAQMGLFETYRIAGGEAGMRHFMAQFGPCLKWPWTKLMDVPEFTDELVDLIAGQSDAQSGHMQHPRTGTPAGRQPRGDDARAQAYWQRGGGRHQRP
jgi:carnitine 3-dehydrogenase